MDNIKIILRKWQGFSLPDRYIFLNNEKKPGNVFKLHEIFFRNWIFHPVKRRIAKYYLLFLKRYFKLKVIGITGSTGKTSTKEMIASILKLKDVTVWSFKNIDPVYNIPTTILKCRPSTKFLVLEMGVEYPGEMDFYLWLAKPDIAVITNIFPTHLLYLNDIKGVLREKSKIVESLGKNGIAVLNIENIYLKKLGKKLKTKVLWFGDDSNVRSLKDEVLLDKSRFLLSLNYDSSKKVWINLPVLGNQFIENALTASVVGSELGASLEEIKKGIENTEFPDHRMKVYTIKRDCYLIDDSYNNNPAAAKQSINVFNRVSGRRKKIIIFGDMLELGDQEEMYHKELGRMLGNLDLSYLICVGQASKLVANEALKTMDKKSVIWVDNWENALKSVKKIISINQIILIKGSRSIKLDNLVEKLLRQYNQSIISK